MKIRLLKDHTLGKQNEVIDIDDKKGNYLVRMKVAEIPSDIDMLIAEHIKAAMNKEYHKIFEEEHEPIVPLDTWEELIREKAETDISREKQEHEGLPTAKKRGRKPKRT